MRIDSLEISCFRGIKGLELRDLGSVNLLLGNNDAGKTSVLEAIKLFEHPLDIDAMARSARLRLVNTVYARDNYTQLESLLSFFPFEQDPVKKLSLCAEFGGQHNELTVTGFLDYVLRSISERELAGPLSYSRKRDMPMTEREVLTFHGEIRFCDETVPVEIDEFFHYRFSPPSRSPLGPVVYSAPGEHLINRSGLSAFRTSKPQEREVVSLLQLIDPEIEGFKLQPNSTLGGMNQIIEHRRFGDLPLYTYGDGMKKIFNLASSVISAKHGLLLIDEVETSLQASNLQHVFGWLLRACARFDVQLFATTHSLESVSALASCASESADAELVCYRLEKDQDLTYGKRFSESELDALVNRRGIDVR